MLKRRLKAFGASIMYLALQGKAAEPTTEPSKVFKEDSSKHNFGIANTKTGAYSPKSDFSFRQKILLRSPDVTGYVCGENEEFSRYSTVFFNIGERLCQLHIP